MGGLSNARKDFRWRLEIDGVNMFELQEIQVPKITLPKILHGSTSNDPDKKTPGKPQFGDLVLKKVKSAFLADTWASDWMAKAMAGGADTFMKVGFLSHLGIDGASVVQKFYLGNCWPTEIEEGNLKSLSPGENLIQTVTCSVDYYYDVNSPQFAALFATGAIGGLAAVIGARDI